MSAAGIPVQALTSSCQSTFQEPFTCSTRRLRRGDLEFFLFFVAVVLGAVPVFGPQGPVPNQGLLCRYWTDPRGSINGVAFAGDYLSAASFLGICGMIASYGYDGFLYSIGFLAGWVVALFVIAEPIKRLGKFTFADALDSKRSIHQGIKFTAAISTRSCVSIFYLIPQMVGAGSLITPLLGLPYWAGVVIVGVTVTVIVVTAGMVSTTWVQFIKGSLLVVVCFVLVTLILNRGLSGELRPHRWKPRSLEGGQVIAPEGEWKTKPYVRVRFPGGQIITYRAVAKESAGFLAKLSNDAAQWTLEERQQELTLAQTRSVKRQTHVSMAYRKRWATHQTSSRMIYAPDWHRQSRIAWRAQETGPLSRIAIHLSRPMQKVSTILTWPTTVIRRQPTARRTTVSYRASAKGRRSARFRAKLRRRLSGVLIEGRAGEKLDFLSLMLALFCGTAALPHIPDSLLPAVEGSGVALANRRSSASRFRSGSSTLLTTLILKVRARHDRRRRA